MASPKLNGYERESRAALMAARLAWLFETQPQAKHAVVYLSPGGNVMVRALPMTNVRGDRRVIGTYDRSVTLEQILEDAGAFEREQPAP